VDGADSGVYRATPLSRLNVSEGMPTPLAQAEYERLFETLTGDRSGRKPVHATLAIHWARVVELVFACEAVALQARDDEITSDRIHTPPRPSWGRAWASSRPPRLLTHHYRTDEKGFIKEANLIVGTTNNNAAISMSIKKIAEGLIRKGADVTDGVLNRIEMAFRAYDLASGAPRMHCRGRCRWRSSSAAGRVRPRDGPPALLRGAPGGSAHDLPLHDQSSLSDCGGKGWIERKCLNPDEARVCPHCNGSGSPARKGVPQLPRQRADRDPHRRAAVLREVLRERPLPTPEDM